MKLRIERPIWLGHQPGAPVGVLLANHFNFGAPAPARPMIVPDNLILGDIAESAGANQVACSNLIGFAAMLRANLSDEISRKNGIARALDLFENVAHGLFAVSVFARFCGQFQNRRMGMFGS